MSLKTIFGIRGVYTDPAPPQEPRDYYISEDGVGDGLTSGNPAPISILDEANLIAGDNIYFNKGDTFFLGNYSIAGINNIDIGAYGTGANPIIKGSVYVGGETFTDNGDGTWYTTVATAPKWVTEGDVLLRQAQSSFIPITVNVSSTVRRVNAATVNAFTDSIVGAKMRIKEFSFRMGLECTVTNYDSGTGNITFTGSVSGGAAGMPLILYGQKQFMTQANDWYWDDLTDRLYIKSVSNPNGRDIRIITEDKAFALNNSDDITIDGVDFKHYYLYPVDVQDCEDFYMRNLSSTANRNDGVRVINSGTLNARIDNCTITNNGLRGIAQGQVDNLQITNCILDGNGEQLNLGFPYDANRTSGAIININGRSSNLLVHLCQITNTGYMPIGVWGENHTFTKNLIHDYCTKFSDGGGVYLFHNTTLGGSTSGCLVENNIIYNGIGNTDGITSGAVTTVAGIYFDSGVNNNTANSNVVFDGGSYAMFCNNYTTQHIVTNNILSSNSIALTFRQAITPSGQFNFTLVQNCVCTGNIISMESSTARGIRLYNSDGDTTFNPFSELDNNHYVNPYNTNICDRSSGGAFTNMGLTAWRTYTGEDAAATALVNWKVTPDSDDILIETNPADTPESFNVPAGYKKYDDTSFSNPVSIPAWYGLIHFQKP